MGISTEGRKSFHQIVLELSNSIKRVSTFLPGTTHKNLTLIVEDLTAKGIKSLTSKPILAQTRSQQATCGCLSLNKMVLNPITGVAGPNLVITAGEETNED